MAAYMIILARVRDRVRFLQEYAAPAAALVARFGGEYLVRSPRTRTLEGTLGEGWSSVVSKWPDRDSIERFWTSPDYAPLKAVRQGLADCHVLLVEEP